MIARAERLLFSNHWGDDPVPVAFWINDVKLIDIGRKKRGKPRSEVFLGDLLAGFDTRQVSSVRTDGSCHVLQR